MDALVERQEENDYRAQVRKEMEQVTERAGVNLEALIVRTVLEIVHGKPPTSGLGETVAKLLRDQLSEEERLAAAHKMAREKLGLDVDETRFRAVLEGLAEIGLVRPGDGGSWAETRDSEVKRLSEENERLRAQLAEFTAA